MTNLRKARQKENMSQAKLAMKAKVSYANLSRYENGWQLPTKQTAERLAGVLGVKVPELFPNETLKDMAGIS